MELQIVTRELAPQVDLVELAGDVDIYTAPQMKAALQKARDQGARFFVLSLEQVEMLDSTGLGALVGERARTRQGGGDLSLICAQRRLLRLFHITGLRSVFRIHASEAAFMQAYQQEGEAAFSQPAMQEDLHDDS